jgi:hypothetical protein
MASRTSHLVLICALAVPGAFGAPPSPAAPEPGDGIVLGHVVDAAGRPIAGADVRLTRLDRDLGPLSYSSMRATRSDAAGAFRFDGVAHSSWLLDARDGQRYLPYPRRIVMKRQGQAVDADELKLEPAATVEGVVKDEFGRPIEGVGVAVGDGGLQGKNVDPVAVIDLHTGQTFKLPPGSSYPRLPLRIALTDAEGRFRLGPILPEIPTSLRIGGLAAYHDTTVTNVFAPAGGAASVEVVLRRGASVVGRLLLPDGRPAAGARVSLLLLETQPSQDAWIVLPRGSDGQCGVEAAGLVTGPEGLFRFEGLHCGRYVVTADVHGFARSTSSLLAILRDGDVVPIEMELEFGRAVRGRLADPGAMGVAGTVVEVLAAKGERSGVEPFLAPQRRVLGSDGAFEFRLRDDEAIALRVSCPGLPSLVFDAIELPRPADGDEATLLAIERTPTGLVLKQGANDPGVAAAPSATPARW